MGDLEFRKFLTTYGITKEEYDEMTDDRKEELQKKYKLENKAENMKNIGASLQGCGCSLMLIPILIVIVVFIFMLLF